MAQARRLKVVARLCRCHEPPLSVCLRLLSLRRTLPWREGFSPEFKSTPCGPFA
ncbi:unnamed protein product [Ciceribacter sp. T2.26MG-112.2]|nr:unnamed protein product [Ciceribacter naphthalenivorans]